MIRHCSRGHTQIHMRAWGHAWLSRLVCHVLVKWHVVPTYMLVPRSIDVRTLLHCIALMPCLTSGLCDLLTHATTTPTTVQAGLLLISGVLRLGCWPRNPSEVLQCWHASHLAECTTVWKERIKHHKEKRRRHHNEGRKGKAITTRTIFPCPKGLHCWQPRCIQR